MDLLNDDLKKRIDDEIARPLTERGTRAAVQGIEALVDDLYAKIPDAKRISYGRVFTIKTLSRYLFERLCQLGAPIFPAAAALLENSHDYRSAGVALGVLANDGSANPAQVFPVFETAAASDAFEIREMAQMFFRTLIGRHAVEAKGFLMHLVGSDDHRKRRFAAETLRPVVENRWFYDDPDYPLSILRHLFKESARYPRTSVGNNLSDLSRRLPGLVIEVAEELVSSGDANSYWIAYRACRNLVKKHPLQVMDILRINEYRYKKRLHRRSDYSGDCG